jgi:hypothetical protein
MSLEDFKLMVSDVKGPLDVPSKCGDGVTSYEKAGEDSLVQYFIQDDVLIAVVATYKNTDDFKKVLGSLAEDNGDPDQQLGLLRADWVSGKYFAMIMRLGMVPIRMPAMLCRKKHMDDEAFLVAMGVDDPNNPKILEAMGRMLDDIRR